MNPDVEFLRKKMLQPNNVLANRFLMFAEVREWLAVRLLRGCLATVF